MMNYGHLVTFGFSVAAAVGISLASMGVLAETDQQAEPATVSAIDQTEVCVASSDQQALECPEGKLFMARLSQQEGEVNTLQLENRLLNTMALYCDANHPIHHTKTGVLCVLTHQRIRTEE